MITARIPLPGPDELSPDQRAVFDRIVGGRRGALVGPLRAALHNPELADRWQALGQVLRYDTCLPPSLSEIAILVVGRHWSCELEWTIHAAEARRSGVAEASIAALRLARAPAFADPAERETYDFARELLATGRISDAAYAAVLARWGVVGVVELTALVGYYSMVAMTLNAHRIPLPAGIRPELEADHEGLAPLPPA